MSYLDLYMIANSFVVDYKTFYVAVSDRHDEFNQRLVIDFETKKLRTSADKA